MIWVTKLFFCREEGKACGALKVRECSHGDYTDSAQLAGSLLAGAAGISAYCASKFAVRGFMDSLRLEVRPTACWPTQQPGHKLVLSRQAAPSHG